MNREPSWRANPILWVAVSLAALSLGAWAAGTPVGIITQIAIYVLYGAGVNFMVGYAGLVPFGASVFFGCASYATALAMITGLVGNEPAALAFGVVFSMALGLVLGSVILRRRGLYFSLLTLACSQIAFEIAFKWTDFTGGENGLQNVPRPWLTSFPLFHAFALATVVAGLWIMWRIVHSPFGRALQALRDNEQRVMSLGYNPYRLKLTAFTICAGLVGYAGGLLSFLIQGAYANNLSWNHAGDALLMTVLGGVHHFLGPLWGAIVYILLEDRLSAVTENWWLIFAPIIMLFALFSPEGIQGMVQRLRRNEHWTLVRRGVPPRPAAIAPYRPSRLAADPDAPILVVRGLNKRFGSIVTASDIDLEVRPYQIHSLIGPNGAGKTTFFNLLTGLVKPDGGEIVLDGHRLTGLAVHQRIRQGLSRSFQIVSVFRNLTAFENVRVAVQAHSPHALALWRDAYRLEEVNAETWSLLDAVGLAGRADTPCVNLSHGEQRLLEIAISLATRAKLLLLDEPLAGLADAERGAVANLIQQLAANHAVLLIEHDIDRVLAISHRITVLHQGCVIADGKPDEVAADPAVVTAYLGKAGEGERPAVVAAAGTAAVAGPLLSLEKLCGGYAGSRILDELDFTVNQGEVVALLGRNGVGKTTTLRAITGTIMVESGRILLEGREITAARPYEIIRQGISIVPEGRRLFPNLTVVENLRIAARPGGAALDEIYELFPKLAVLRRARAESLSGGERQMVAIARALMAPSRLILLDEPFEGLAPAVVKEVMEAIVRLRGRVSLVIVEHHAEKVLPIVDRAYVLVNGRIAFEGAAATLAADKALQARLLGVAGKA